MIKNIDSDPINLLSRKSFPLSRLERVRVRGDISPASGGRGFTGGVAAIK